MSHPESTDGSRRQRDQPLDAASRSVVDTKAVESDRVGRTERERRHFEHVAATQSELYWADRMPAASRRQAQRARLLADGAEASQGDLILDIGCGTGAYSRPLASSTDATVVAIDLSAEIVRGVLQDAPANLTPAAADAGRLPFPDGTFAAVVGNGVLHHLPLDAVLPELLRVLRPGGLLCFAEPNLLNPQVFVERRVKWIGRLLDNSPDETAFVRWRICETLGRLGLVEVSARPFDFLYPLTPRPLLGAMERLGRVLERTPLLREIAGSLLIRGRKPEERVAQNAS